MSAVAGNASRRTPASPYGRQVSAVELERERYRRRQGINSTIVSMVSTLVFALLVAAILHLSPGWPLVRQSFFDGSAFVKSLPKIIEGLWLNVKVLLFSLVGVAVISTLLALLRISKSPALFPLRVLAAAYTTLMRGIPMIVVLYLVGFGIPGLGLFGRIPAALLGTIAIIMGYSAYTAEDLRAGFQDVNPGQRASARSLGLTAGQTVRLVIIPQALRKIAPVLMNTFISMQKDVGLISVLGAVDAVRAAQIQVAQTYNFTPYVAASVVFILMSVPFIILNDWYTNRLRQREQSGGMV